MSIFAIMLQKIKQLSHSDFLGIVSSFVCLVHCLAFPLMLSAGYLFSFLGSGHWHSLDYLFVGLGTIAAGISARRSAVPAIKLAFWITIFIFSLSILLHDLWIGMVYLSVGASIMLIFLHGYHWRLHLKYHK